MRIRTVLGANTLLSVLLIGLGLVFRSRMPDPLAVHWGANGIADGYGSDFVGIWMLPLMVIGLTALLAAIPRIDPLRENIKKFSNEYHQFILLFGALMLYMQMLTLAYNLDWIQNLNPYFMPAFGIFFFFIGQMTSKARRNYFIGIRTPWTLQDERVWDETHRKGGMAFKIVGIIALMGVFFPDQSIWFLMVPLIIVIFYTIFLSYFLYQKYNPKT